MPSKRHVYATCTADTGPMYIKYNTLLRARSGLVPAFVQKAEEMCVGNTYASTMQVP
jgi:hypothetical protein